MTESLTGSLLVASTLVTDPVYAGGVCLVVHQDDSNVIGVMLNRPMKPTPEALVAMMGGSNPPSEKNRLIGLVDENPASSPALPDADESADSIENSGDHGINHGKSDQGIPWDMLHFGGPRSGPVVAIHQHSKYAEAETGDGIYVAAQKQHLEDLVRQHPGPYRLIVGHLCWESDQLQSEIDSGIWHILPATSDSVFSTASEMWPRLIRRATSSSVARWLGIPDLPSAGELN